MDRKLVLIRLGLCVILFMLICSTGCITVKKKSGTGIAWLDDYEDALASANASQKPIMIDFYTSWCYWCDKLDEETYSDPEVVDKAAAFVCLKIDGDARGDLVNKYALEGYPTIIFLNSEGTEVDRIVGYVDASELLAHMSKI